MIDLPWIVPIGLGLAVVALGIGLAAYQWRRRGWSRTTATIVSVKKQTSRQSNGAESTVYRTTYRYVDDVTEEPRTGAFTSMRRRKKKQELAVRYDPADPAVSQVTGPAGQVTWWLGAALALVVGGGLIAIGYADVLAQTS